MPEFSSTERWVLRLLRVPPEPEPPEGSPESVQIFRAGRNLYIWCLLVWLISHLTMLAVLIAIHLLIGIKFSKWPDWAQTTWRVLEATVFVIFVASAFVTFFSQRLNYLLRCYIVTDHGLRIRSGILSMQEITMTFSNIQEIRVTAGPLQNLLRIADVEVQSAGGGAGGPGDDGHIGRFQGVSNSSAIRDLMVERLRQYRDLGLGGSESHPAADQATHQAIDAARLVLTEARSLRKLIDVNGT